MKCLICITTSNRSMAIKALAWEYIEFCKSEENYEFLIALDGNDKKTISFCQKHHIPILYSDEREGVGLSKNRVLETYPNYDHYFFIEDDVGLINPDVFNIYIESAKEINVQHMSLCYEDRIKDIKENITLKNGLTVTCSNYGSALFNYFTKSGINKVGGFHPNFAKYRRFGHTEHSYRFVNSGIAKYPFYVILDCTSGFLEWSDPVSVTKIKVDTINRLFTEEHDLIKEKICHVPITTLCNYYPPKNLSLKSTKKPTLLSLYRLKFSSYNLALSTYRLIKTYRNKIRER